MTFLITFFSFILGALIGSFLNVLILRLPEGKKPSGRSYCPNCKAIISFFDLIPVISYLVLGGKCRNCGKAISPRYLIIEITTGLIFGLVASRAVLVNLPGYLLLAKLLFAAGFLVVIFVIDLEHFLILDEVLTWGAAVILLFNLVLDFLGKNNLFALSSNFWGGIFAALIAGIFFFAIWFFSRGKWMGFGDVKFSLVLGLLVGWPNIILLLFLSFCLGSLVSLPLLFSGRKKLNSQVPFGTFLSVSALITLLYGQVILNWYLALIGWN